MNKKVKRTQIEEDELIQENEELRKKVLRLEQELVGKDEDFKRREKEIVTDLKVQNSVNEK